MSLGIQTSDVISQTWLVNAFKASCEIKCWELHGILLQFRVVAVTGCPTFGLSLGDFLASNVSLAMGTVAIGVLLLVTLW